jgi:small subunit ribosomal protein S16
LVKLRLMRLGRKKRPFYRIVAADVNSPRSGGNLAQVGVYDPLDATVKIDEEEVVKWLERGAQMTPTVKALMHSQGVLGRWKGFESTASEDALSKDKPKRRKKLTGAAAMPAAEAEAPAVEQTTEEPAVNAEEAPEATAEASSAVETSAEAPTVEAEAPTEAVAVETESAGAEEAPAAADADSKPKAEDA